MLHDYTIAHAVAAAVVLSVLLQSSALALTTVEHLGVVHLTWLGIRTIRAGPQQGRRQRAPSGRGTLAAADRDAQGDATVFERTQTRVGRP